MSQHNSGSTWVPRTDYQMCLTDLPDDEGDPKRDLYALQAYSVYHRYIYYLIPFIY
jgi:hypothetical protein